MKQPFLRFSRRYRAALRAYLQPGGRADLTVARQLGGQALAAGLEILDLAKLHEQVLVAEVLPGRLAHQCPALIKRAGGFFALAISPIEKTHRSAREASARLKKFVAVLSQRTVELAAANVKLNLEIARRKRTEEALQKKERHYSQLLKQSHQLQEQLRCLSGEVLSVQEEERKRISRELHDVIAQVLTGINLRLATLKKASSMDTKGLDRNITRTQLLVEKSVNLVHEFARELRPAVLDDLGLVPALHSFVKLFSKRTGLHIHLKVSAEIGPIPSDQRTCLYRVAQEALTNVSRHAQATSVVVSVQKLARGLCLKIHDNGKSFEVERVLNTRGRKHLGLFGMRERTEIVGGHFDIKSNPGRGTTVTVLIPAARLGGKHK